MVVLQTYQDEIVFSTFVAKYYIINLIYCKSMWPELMARINLLFCFCVTVLSNWSSYLTPSDTFPPN